MKKLMDSELRYRCLFEAAQDGILILDAETGMFERGARVDQVGSDTAEIDG